MIDILSVVYRNYDLMVLNALHWNKFMNYRLLICDNTLQENRGNYNLEGILAANQNIDAYSFPMVGIDGFTHGFALDFLKEKTTSKIVGTIDSDFFWLCPDILSYVEDLFEEGYEAVGCAGWYPDWQANIDTRYPERAGHLAPVIWGQFLSRELIMSDTFICTQEEASETKETGWRTRERIIKEKRRVKIFPGFKYDNQEDTNVCYFGTPEYPMGVHLLKGSQRTIDMEHVEKIIEEGGKRWQIP